MSSIVKASIVIKVDFIDIATVRVLVRSSCSNILLIISVQTTSHAVKELGIPWKYTANRDIWRRREVGEQGSKVWEAKIVELIQPCSCKVNVGLALSPVQGEFTKLKDVAELLKTVPCCVEKWAVGKQVGVEVAEVISDSVAVSAVPAHTGLGRRVLDLG